MKLIKLFKQALKLPELLGVTAEAEDQRNRLALAAIRVVAVATPEEDAAAAVVAQDAQDYVKSVEEGGLDFRRPITAFLALVKRTEVDHLAPLLQEKERVEMLRLGFRQREKQRVEDEERKRSEEFHRREEARQREEHRLAQERARREAEVKKVQDATDAKLRKEREAAEALAAAARNKKQREEAEAACKEAERKEVAAEADRRIREANLRAMQERDAEKVEADKQANYDLLRQPLPQVAKATGATVKREMQFEVVSIVEVYTYRPELVKLEVKASAVRAVCFPREDANVSDKDETTVPGLKLWYVDSLSTRRRQLAIAKL